MFGAQSSRKNSMDLCDLHGYCNTWADRCHSGSMRLHCNVPDPWHCYKRTECVKIVANESNLESTYKIAVNVENFNINELRVKSKNGDKIIVEGKKNVDDDKRMFCPCSMNEFTRVYKLPRNFNAKDAQVVLYSDNVLLITIPGLTIDNVEQDITILANPNGYNQKSSKTEVEGEIENEIEKDKEEVVEPEVV